MLAHGTEAGGDGRIGQQHFSRQKTQQRRTNGNDHGEALHDFGEQGRAKNNQRNTDQQAQHQQRQIAFGRRRHRQNVVQTHHQIGNQDGADGRSHAVDLLALTVSVVLGLEQIDANVDQQNRADQLQVGQGQQLDRHNGQHNPHHDGRSTAPENGFIALLWLECSRCHGDNHGVVTREDDIGKNDGAESAPEQRRGKIKSEKHGGSVVMNKKSADQRFFYFPRV